MISAPRTERVELAQRHVVLEQVPPGRRILGNRTRGRDVIGGDRVGQHDQHARVLDIGGLPGLAAEALEERRLLHVGGAWIPFVQVALFRQRQRLPVLVTLEDLGVFLQELVGSDRLLHRLAHFGLGRPQVAQVDRVPVRVAPDRIGRQVDVYRPRQCEGDHQRRRREI